MKLTLKRAVMVAAVLALCVLTVVAGNKNRIGTAGAQELLIPVSARGIALGGSSVTLMTGADAIFYNPAGIARSQDNIDALFSSMSYIGGIGVNYAALTAHAGSIGSFGLSLKSLSFGDIPVTTEDFPDGTGETFSPTFVNLGLSYSNMLSDRISVGVTATLITESFMSVSASGIGFNVGVQYTGLALPGLSLGVVVKNVGGQMKFDGSNLLRQGTVNDATRNSNANWYKVNVASFDLPTTIDLGVSYQTKLNEKISANVLGNFMNSNYAYDEYRLGAEFIYDKMFFVRGGYVIAPDAGKDAANQDAFLYSYSLGAGLNVNIPGANIRVDYAYRAMKYFDANNVFTVALGF